MSLQPQSYPQWAASSASLVSPSLSKLADSPPNEVDGAVLDYLVIELVEAFRASAAVAKARFQKHEQDMISAGFLPQSAKRRTEPSSSGFSEEDQGLVARLELAGKHVGANLTERLTRDRPRFNEPLESVKFICKDVWIACFGKQVDNLRTNHRGIYIIQDNSFRPILRISSWDGQHETIRHAKLYVNFAVGILQGVTQRLGLAATVTAEVTQPPQCGFQIKLSK